MGQSNWIEILQTILLLVLVDRTFLLRKHYKLAIEFTKDKYVSYWALWIYCKQAQGERYGRNGGKRLLYFNFK